MDLDDSLDGVVERSRVYLGQLPEVVGVEEKLFEGAGVADQILGYGAERAVALVHVLHLSVAPLEDGDALEHDDPNLFTSTSLDTH